MAAPARHYFSGYASLFERRDLAGDVVARGAFRTSLAERTPGSIAMLYQHDATRPIGRWTRFEERMAGLWVEGFLVPNLRLADDVAALIAAGALRGLSIGFRARKSQNGQRKFRRRLLSVELVEISLVTFPMQPDARIDNFGTLAKRPSSPQTQ